MNEYGGVDMMIDRRLDTNKKMAKSTPRSGAAKGQGEGMGGYNASSVNKALGMIKGASKASYSSGAGSQMNKK